MAGTKNWEIIVNGVKWAEPALDGVKIDNKYMLADAERTQTTMHFEKLGEVWIVEITYNNLTDAEFNAIYESLKPFVVEASIYNPYTLRTLTTTFYRGDLSYLAHWRNINGQFKVTLTGTEIFKS